MSKANTGTTCLKADVSTVGDDAPDIWGDEIRASQGIFCSFPLTTLVSHFLHASVCPIYKMGTNYIYPNALGCLKKKVLNFLNEKEGVVSRPLEGPL